MSCYLGEQYQFPAYHLFVEEFEKPFLKYTRIFIVIFLSCQHDPFFFTIWPWITATKSGSSSPWRSLSCVAIPLPQQAYLPEAGPRRPASLSAVRWPQLGTLSLSGICAGKVLLPVESKLLIFFCQQLTSAASFDSKGEQFVLYPSWRPKDMRKKRVKKKSFLKLYT